MEELQNASRGGNEFARQSILFSCIPTEILPPLQRVVSQLSGAKISIRKGAESETEWRIADDPDGICGAMRGLACTPYARDAGRLRFFHRERKLC